MSTTHSAADVRSMLAQVRDRHAGEETLAVRYDVLDNLLASQEAAERAVAQAQRWQKNMHYAFADAVALAERNGDLMLARRLRVLSVTEL